MIKRIVLLVLLVAITVLLLGTGGAYWAVSSAEPRYVAALEQPPEMLEESSRQLESRITTLSSDLQSEGNWQTVVSADELNGWLAYKLPESFPELLPKEIRDPRVVITPSEVVLAARSEVAGIDTVVSVIVEPYVTEEGDLAIELRQVLAGALPVPTKDIIDRLRRATARAGLKLRWTQNGGNTVMIIGREMWDTEDTQHRVLEALELADGEMFLSGKTEEVEVEERTQNPSDDT
ncbi:hypothetical protein [Aeoliella sp. SH292]|uniref:hypothetical protein n=1 Tax=Aeoliella sp. SH292 TaxID=3454464 RepID=UPI003F9BEEF8